MPKILTQNNHQQTSEISRNEVYARTAIAATTVAIVTDWILVLTRELLSEYLSIGISSSILSILASPEVHASFWEHIPFPSLWFIFIWQSEVISGAENFHAESLKELADVNKPGNVVEVPESWGRVMLFTHSKQLSKLL